MNESRDHAYTTSTAEPIPRGMNYLYEDKILGTEVKTRDRYDTATLKKGYKPRVDSGGLDKKQSGGV